MQPPVPPRQNDLRRDEEIRLQCLSLAVRLMSVGPQIYPDKIAGLQMLADAMLRYVHTGSMVIEPTPPPRYRMEEVESGET
jgi:hypothetical protein